MSEPPHSKPQALVSLEQIISRSVSQLRATAHMAAQDRWDAVYSITSDVIESLSSVLEDVEEAEDDEALGARLSSRASPAERRGATWMRAAIMSRLKERGMNDAYMVVHGMDVVSQRGATTPSVEGLSHLRRDVQRRTRRLRVEKRRGR